MSAVKTTVHVVVVMAVALGIQIIRNYFDLPPNTTVQLFSLAGMFIFSWRFPVPGDYRISMWGPLPNLQQISQIYNPSCGNKR